MNIFDYLDWRADIPFSFDPFNEVDNLVLSELAYTKFKEMLFSIHDEMTIEEADEMFFTIHSEEEIRKAKGYTAVAPLLLRKMAHSKRYGKTKIFAHIDILDENTSEQVSAVSFKLPDHTIYVAYRGTDSTIVGWKEDLRLSYQNDIPGHLRASEYLKTVVSMTRLPLRVGGHSKGGNFAVYAAMSMPRRIRQKRILYIYSNDGPGFKSETIQRQEYQEILPKIISVIPEDSMIGMLMENQYAHHIVKSTNKTIEQHDGFSWQVMRNHFVETDKRGEFSYFFDRTLRLWLEGIDDNTRQEFLDAVFSVYEATGKTTVIEVSDDLVHSVAVMVKAMASMNKETKKLMMDIIAKLIKSTGSELSKEIVLLLPTKENAGE